MWEKKIACSGSRSEWEGRASGGEEEGGCARTALLNIWLALRISWSGERWAVCRLCRVAVATTGAACGVSSHSCARRSLNGRGSMRACAAACRSAVRPRHALRHSWLRRCYHFTSPPTAAPRRAAPLPPQLNVFTVNLTLRRYYYLTALLPLVQFFYL